MADAGTPAQAYGAVFQAVRPNAPASATGAKRRAAALAALVAVVCVTALVYVGVDRASLTEAKAKAGSTPQELSEDEALIKEDANALQDSRRLKNAAWLAQKYASHPQLKGLSAEKADATAAKLIQQHAIEQLQKEEDKQKLHAAGAQALQEDDTPTYFNDPFLDNGGFFKVCQEVGCTHGEAHQACMAAGAELASIHSMDDVTEAAATCAGTPGSFKAEFYQYNHGLSALPNLFDLTLTPTYTEETTDVIYPQERFEGVHYHYWFAVKWTGDIAIESGGQYTFRIASDDGSMLYIGNQLVIDDNGLHGYQDRSGTVNLEPGYYPITITFFENEGDAHMEAQYSGPDTGGSMSNLVPAPELPCYIGLTRDTSMTAWRYMDKSTYNFHNWQNGAGVRGGEVTKAAISPGTGLWSNAGVGEFSFPGVCRKPPCHYLYFRGIPCPPDDYVAPTGASPNTWPQIYRNLQNIDYCTDRYKSIKNRLLCIKSFYPANFLQ